MSLIDLHAAPRRLLGLVPRARAVYARLDAAYCMETVKIVVTLLATLAAIYVTGVDTFLDAVGLSIAPGLEAPGPAAPPANVIGVVDGMCSSNALADEDEAPRMVISPQGAISHAPARCAVAPMIILPTQ
jgi:hypothetical protein